jgi:hypothetical protein
MKSPLAIMTVYSVASRLPSLRSALRGLDTTSVHGHLESWATARKPPAGALARKIVKTQTRYSWCPRNRGNSGPGLGFQARPSGARGRAPARCISRRGFVTEIGRKSPLRKMTSAAYGVGRDSTVDALAERCPVRLSSRRLRLLGACPMKRSHTRHAPI